MEWNDEHNVYGKKKQHCKTNIADVSSMTVYGLALKGGILKEMGMSKRFFKQKSYFWSNRKKKLMFFF